MTDPAPLSGLSYFFNNYRTLRLFHLRDTHLACLSFFLWRMCQIRQYLAIQLLTFHVMTLNLKMAVHARTVAVNLTGSAAGETLDGSDQADEIDGGAGADTINGHGGADVLVGGTGDDRLSGGDGNDHLYGGDGNDQLDGGAGNDWLQDEAGNDVLRGGDGDDGLTDAAGDSLQYGGAGNDTLTVSGAGTHALYGEAGNDTFEAWGGNALLDGGDGNDRFFILRMGPDNGGGLVQVRGGAGNDDVTLMAGLTGIRVEAAGGAGSDTYRPMGGIGGYAFTVTDFTVGPGGDRIDPLLLVAPSAGGNPFAAGGTLRMLQRGADAVLQMRPAADAAGAFQDVLVLQNVQSTALTTDNFTLNLNPDGSNVGLRWTGTDRADVLQDGWLDDRLEGGAGNDVLTASVGNDTLFGGDGDDVLDGDNVTFSSDSDIPYTWQSVRTGNDRIEGGAGDDTLLSAFGNDVLLGGAGDDLLRLEARSGGRESTQLVVLDGGDGNDRFDIRGYLDRGENIEMTGGAGSDTFSLRTRAYEGVLTIRDFQAGAGGDVLDVFEAAGWGRPAPFPNYFRITQRGADTVIQIDTDGTGSRNGFTDLVTLENVAVDSLVAANMRYGYLPGTVVKAGATLAGTAAADRLDGGLGNDLLQGDAGNDILRGSGGNDTLKGGDGLDTAVYSGLRAQYEIDAGGRVYDTGLFSLGDLRGGLHDGRDLLANIERLMFADGALALDLDGAAGQAYRIYRAAFDRAPDEVGLGFWIAALDRGMTLGAVAGGFANSQEFRDLYGAAPSNADVVALFYRNVLDREPDGEGYAFWIDVLDSGRASVADVLASFSESNENVSAVAELVGQGIAYQPWGG